MIKKVYGILPTPTLAKPDLRLLCHPNIPKPLHGIAPRVIAGKAWWDIERQTAYARAGYCCQACGTPKPDVLGARKVLEAHEVYDYDYEKGRLTFKRLVALCPACHAFIHSGRTQMQVEDGVLTQERYDEIMNRGRDLIAKAGLLEEWEERHSHNCSVRWADWRMVFEGREYGPSSASMEEWANDVWKNWKPTQRKEYGDES